MVFYVFISLVEKNRVKTAQIKSSKIENLHLAHETLQQELLSIQYQSIQLPHNMREIKDSHAMIPNNSFHVGQHETAMQTTTNGFKTTPNPAPIVGSTQSNDVSQRNKSLRRAIIFTMDSISSYEQNSMSGGAAGQHLVP